MFCGVCGKKLLNENELICPGCHGRVKNDLNYCTSCGDVKNGKKKCKSCGEKYYNTKKVGGRRFTSDRIYSLFFSVTWTMISLQGLLSSIFAEKGIYIEGNYVSVMERKANIPIEIMMLAFGVFMIVNDIRGRKYR
ncbi:MAG: hypothetical protein ACRC28_16925 [Clostridium sp.]|uniref:hypothetical protein n=1 Tax=Clostridium sp. TaxID=1506 RepID=UPI003F2C12D9